MELALSYSLSAVDVQSFIVHNCSIIPESIFLFVTVECSHKYTFS